jgi:DNA invertase Pin-like site-specific DNA recombinase
MGTRVMGYIRVSTEGQADDGISLAAQRAKLEAYALAMDLDLVAVHQDAGLSAKTVSGRPGMLQALADLNEGRADGILVVKLDRLTRSVRDLGDLVEQYFMTRFSLMSVSDGIDTRTAAGRLVLNVRMSVAQWEREATAERTRDAMAYLRSTGVAIGGVALGHRRTDDVDDKGRRVVVEDDEELETVRRIHELRREGASFREIAGKLAAEGRPSKRGGKWAPATVRKVLIRNATPAIEARDAT